MKPLPVLHLRYVAPGYIFAVKFVLNYILTFSEKNSIHLVS